MAERHWVNGGVNLLWSTIGNWSLTEGGAGGQTVPTAAEDVFFDAGSPDCTVNSSARVGKTLTASAYTHTLTMDQHLRISGNINIGANTLFAGTTTNYLGMIADGTFTTNGVTISHDIYFGIAASIAVTLAGDLTTSGALIFAGSTGTTFSGDFHITAASCTIGGSQTITIVHDVTINGLTTSSDANVITGLFNWNTGGLTTTGNLTGTATIVLTGGTWTGAVGSLANPLVFAGDSAISGTVFCLSPTITWSSGTITAGTSILSHGAAACTWNTNGMSFANVALTVAATHTINSLLTVTGTLTLPNAATTFAGTAGFTVGTLANTTIATSARTVTLVSAKTYTVTTAMNLAGATTTLKLNLVVSTPGTKAILTVQLGATQGVAFVFPTDIDSSLGQSIYTFMGTIVTSYNWGVVLTSGNITTTTGGESVTVAGITKDNAGTALGSCDVYLFRDNGNDTATYIAYVESNSVTGAYSFTVFPGSSYFVVAFKGGATPVMDVTYRDLVAV